MWYKDIPTLYLARFCLLNEHIVGEDLWKNCKNYGSLSTHSCFPFEFFYGDLIKLKNGTVSYQTAMIFTSGYHQALIYFTQQSNITNATWQGKLMEKIEVPIEIVEQK